MLETVGGAGTIRQTLRRTVLLRGLPRDRNRGGEGFVLVFSRAGYLLFASLVLVAVCFG